MRLDKIAKVLRDNEPEAKKVVSDLFCKLVGSAPNDGSVPVSGFLIGSVASDGRLCVTLEVKAWFQTKDLKTNLSNSSAAR